METSTNASLILKLIYIKLKELLQQDIERFRMAQQTKQVVINKAA